MKRIPYVLIALFFIISFSPGKPVSIPSYIAPFVEKGDRATGPIKILRKGEGYIVCYIYPRRTVVDLSKAEIIGGKDLKAGMKIFLIQKKSGRYIIIPVEDNHENQIDKHKEN
ncbi:hypothetical protein [Persephonella sp.]